MMAAELRGVGLNFYNHIHYTDHLAPLCVFLDIPLLVSDEKYELQVRSFYPGLKTIRVEWNELTPYYLYENFEFLLQSSFWPRERFDEAFKPFREREDKHFRNIHCPHGFSDKIFWLEQCVLEDITLIYGQNMLDLFKTQGVIEKLKTSVRCGNYRYLYYKRHREFFDSLVHDWIFSRFSSNQPTILYAPTYNDVEGNTSFFDSDPIFEKLPSQYNLIVKIHPELEEISAGNLYQFMGKFEKQKNVVFVKDFSLVYPILNRSDFYIGDMSSIGYDFLPFDRPMFFLNQEKRDSKKDRRSFLYRCGVAIIPENYQDIYSMIEKSLPLDKELFSQIRSDVYRYTFGEEVSVEELKANILHAYFSPKA